QISRGRRPGAGQRARRVDRRVTMARDVTGVLVEFARTLRSAGVDASPQRVASMLTAADTEVLRTRDVATLSAVERADVRKMISMLAVGTAPRASRRRIHAVRGD